MYTETRTLLDALTAFEKAYGRYVHITAVLPSIYGAVIRAEDKHYIYNLLTEEISEIKDWREGR